jgi:hypothetical protein
MKIFPVPSAIDGRKWTLEELNSGGACDTRAAKLWVPTTVAADDFFVRVHETVHAKITPQVSSGTAAKKAGVTMEALQVAEDWRVNRFAAARRLVPSTGDYLGAETRAGIFRRAKTDREIALIEFSCFVGEVGEPVKYDRPPGEVEAIRETVRFVLESVTDTVRRGARGRRRSRWAAFEKMLCSKAGFQKFTIPLAKMIDVYFPPNPSKPGAGHGGQLPAKVSGVNDVRWTEPRIEVAPMSVCRRVVRPPSPRPSDCGTVPRFLHRYCDGSGTIWSRKRRQAGGTVLIDGSGSMNWDEEKLVKAMQRAPGTRVAVYSDNRLLVVGEGGRLASYDWLIDRLPGGNGCDGRALDWLLSQEAPRTWVTDMGVTDRNGDHSQAAIDACLNRVKRGAVRVVHSVDRL